MVAIEISFQQEVRQLYDSWVRAVHDMHSSGSLNEHDMPEGNVGALLVPQVRTMKNMVMPCRQTCSFCSCLPFVASILPISRQGTRQEQLPYLPTIAAIPKLGGDGVCAIHC